MILLLVVNYKKIIEVLRCVGNKPKFLLLLEKEIEEENEKREKNEKNMLKETISSLLKDFGPQKIDAETFFKALAKTALDNRSCWTTIEKLYEQLIA